MSQQVYSSGAGYFKPDATREKDFPNHTNVVAPTRYLPAINEIDIFTLIKNNNPGTPGEYGSQIKNLPTTGAGLFFNRLNANDTAATGGIQNYFVFQNPATKPYWILSSKSDVLGGATLLYNKCDNVIACNATIPGSFPSGSGNIPFKLQWIVMDDAFNILRNYALDGSQAVLGNNTPDPFSCNAVINCLAGEIVALFGYATANNFRYEDDLNGNPSITIQCMVTFAKM